MIALKKNVFSFPFMLQDEKQHLLVHKQADDL